MLPMVALCYEGIQLKVSMVALFLGNASGGCQTPCNGGLQGDDAAVLLGNSTEKLEISKGKGPESRRFNRKVIRK